MLEAKTEVASKRQAGIVFKQVLDLLVCVVRALKTV